MVKPIILAVKCRRERAAARAVAGSLRSQAIAPATRRRYDHACRVYFLWLERIGCPVPSSVEALDENIADYIESLWEDGEARSMAADLLSGLTFFVPALKRRLSEGWRLLTIWQRCELPARATPCSLVVCRALAAEALTRGWQSMACACLLGFQAVLRTGEILGITRRAITFSRDRRLATIDLGYTKGGQRRGERESVIVDDAGLVRFIAALIEQKPAGTSLLEESSGFFRRRFDMLVQALGLAGRGYKPYSLRRGGATHLFRVSGSFSVVQSRGRWSNQKTAQTYVQEAACVLDALTLPAR